MSELFSVLRLRGLEFRNRVFVSPMCQYSSREGLPNDWHMVHLGSRAVGGAALVCAEATAVSPEGRISPGDTGLWSDAHAEAFAPVAAFIKSQGAVPAVQLAHAGRKASTDVPWRGGKPLGKESGGWETLAPSALSFAEGYPVPREMNDEDSDAVVSQFRDAAARALAGGFEVVELHMAHGYLLHEFLSPLSNRREDEYGGGFENRVRFPLRVTEAVRKVWPERLPLFARISATDWAEGGWDLEQSIEFSKLLKSAGIDLIDCSSGGLLPGVKIPVGPGYQVPFAAAVRERAGIATGAVGMITEAHQAEGIIAGGEADAVLLARAMLRDPYWTLRAAKALGVKADWPVQYGRADG
ncbi:MAG TPA: NADH:flavin oxidoreductase/NADH oxidase [Pyrinomonadaceae bacterium]|jgi:2,4-dienoyl-CoA reductase-like NADH-dependent reductase (Old Yellow Enzyme family)|nr:NADH:flavin oxidoreductase/NADH oxidase [Pyrinomonadaceae bacterium]